MNKMPRRENAANTASGAIRKPPRRNRHAKAAKLAVGNAQAIVSALALLPPCRAAIARLNGREQGAYKSKSSEKRPIHRVAPSPQRSDSPSGLRFPATNEPESHPASMQVYHIDGTAAAEDETHVVVFPGNPGTMSGFLGSPVLNACLRLRRMRMRRCPPGWSVLYFSFYIDFMHSLHRLSRGRWSVHGVSYAGHDSQCLIKRSMPLFRSVGRQFSLPRCAFTFAFTFAFTLHPGSFCPNPCRPLGRLGMSDALRLESVRPQWPLTSQRPDFHARRASAAQGLGHGELGAPLALWKVRFLSVSFVCRMTYVCECSPVRSCTLYAAARTGAPAALVRSVALRARFGVVGQARA